MKLVCSLLLLGLATLARVPAGVLDRTLAAAAPASGGGLRAFSGAVDIIARDEQPLPAYLDRLEATLVLELSHGGVGPYLVSVANSLEALSPAERGADARRGERLLLTAYVALANLAGPQGARLAGAYAAGLAQILAVKSDEMTVSAELQDNLRRLGELAASTATRQLAAGGAESPVERGALRVQLLLAQGRYAAALHEAQALEAQAPGPLHHAYRLGAQRLLRASPADSQGLQEMERGGGAPAVLAQLLERRAAREALRVRIVSGLPALKPAPRRAAGAVAEAALLNACESLLSDPAGRARPQASECALYLQDSPSSRWAESPLPAVPGVPEGRMHLLNLARALGALLGLPGRPPTSERAERGAALAEVARLAPQAGLPAEEALAVTLIAEVAAARPASGPPVAPQLQPAIDKFLSRYPCSRVALPLIHGRHTADLAHRQEALRRALAGCGQQAQAATTVAADDAQRQLALAVLGINARDEIALPLLGTLAERHHAAGEGRFALSLADGEALRAFEVRGAAISDSELAALQRRYQDALGQLVPLDGAEGMGRVHAQLAALALWRKPATEDGLAFAQARLRFARVLSGAEDTPRVQALEVALLRERTLLAGQPLVAPVARAADLERLPAGPLRRVLACELEITAQRAHDAAAAGFHALAAGTPLPEIITLGQPRLTASLGSDERLRIGTRSNGQVLILPRCGG